ncbi:hypothetical protein PGT21_029285 [Puccinia graminis f. sp. tritici]|uniref:Uncharacterized protein n=1 Tax=Puccinia graminis f. sp. tritici TaxID=56615 RepID=A0A5B0NZK6_PUCGR|nr:hypothetical protein PGT21_029285 [Puccinia graminis f. sp. tritici]
MNTGDLPGPRVARGSKAAPLTRICPRLRKPKWHEFDAQMLIAGRKLQKFLSNPGRTIIPLGMLVASNAPGPTKREDSVELCV